MLGGRNREDQVAGTEIGQFAGHRHMVVEDDPGQEGLVDAAGADAVDHLGFPRLQQDIQPGPTRDLGQGRAPGTGTDHACGLERHGHSLKPWRPCGPAHASGR